MKEFRDLKIYQLLEKGERIRVLAFGSSNTQRFLAGAHWFDYVGLGFKTACGGACGQFIECGKSGDTTEQLLERFDMDVKRYEPHLVFLTVGVNDASTARNISAGAYKANLLKIVEKIHHFGGEVIFQTYYACDEERLEPDFVTAIRRNMQILRDTAAETGSALNDNYSRWDKLRLKNPRLYRLLMRDNLHVNPDGNCVIGLDLIRKFGLVLNEENWKYCGTGLFAQQYLDTLE